MRDHTLDTLRRLRGWARVFGLGLVLGLGLVPPASRANETAPAGADPAIEARTMALAAELRCLVCQNQSLAESHAGLAEDLRRQLRELLASGMSEAQIRSYMTERYGDFVLYRPPFRARTAALWLGPALLMSVAVGTLLVVLRRRQRLASGAFDADVVDDVHGDAAPR